MGTGGAELLVYKFKIDGSGGSEATRAFTTCVDVFGHLRYEVRVKVPGGHLVLVFILEAGI